MITAEKFLRNVPVNCLEKRIYIVPANVKTNIKKLFLKVLQIRIMETIRYPEEITDVPKRYFVLLLARCSIVQLKPVKNMASNVD